MTCTPRDAAMATTSAHAGPSAGSAWARCHAHGACASAQSVHDPHELSASSGNTTRSHPRAAASATTASILWSVAALSRGTDSKLAHPIVIVVGPRAGSSGGTEVIIAERPRRGVRTATVLTNMRRDGRAVSCGGRDNLVELLCGSLPSEG